MNNAYEIAAATYLLIGILFGTIGPAGKDIAKEVDRARGSPLTNAFMEREAPSEAFFLSDHNNTWLRFIMAILYIRHHEGTLQIRCFRKKTSRRKGRRNLVSLHGGPWGHYMQRL